MSSNVEGGEEDPMEGRIEEMKSGLDGQKYGAGSTTPETRESRQSIERLRAVLQGMLEVQYSIDESLTIPRPREKYRSGAVR